MIFRPELVRQILDGRKTQTRRLVEDGKSCRYVRGQAYAVQPGRGKPASARILVTSVDRQVLKQLSFEDARAEGFRTRDDFYAYWRTLHGLGLRAELRDLLERLVDADDGVTLDPRRIHPGLGDAALRARLAKLSGAGLAECAEDGRWDITEAGAERLADPHEGVDFDVVVWAITFRLEQVAEEAPTFLTQAGSMAGTTRQGHLAMRHEPEVMTSRLHVRWRTAAEKRREQASHGGAPEARIARARALARERGIDIGDLELALERRIRAIEKRVKGAA